MDTSAPTSAAQPLLLTYSVTDEWGIAAIPAVRWLTVQCPVDEPLCDLGTGAGGRTCKVAVLCTATTRGEAGRHAMCTLPVCLPVRLCCVPVS